MSIFPEKLHSDSFPTVDIFESSPVCFESSPVCFESSPVCPICLNDRQISKTEFSENGFLDPGLDGESEASPNVLRSEYSFPKSERASPTLLESVPEENRRSFIKEVKPLSKHFKKKERKLDLERQVKETLETYHELKANLKAQLKVHEVLMHFFKKHFNLMTKYFPSEECPDFTSKITKLFSSLIPIDITKEEGLIERIEKIDSHQGKKYKRKPGKKSSAQKRRKFTKLIDIAEKKNRMLTEELRIEEEASRIMVMLRDRIIKKHPMLWGDPIRMKFEEIWTPSRFSGPFEKIDLTYTGY